MRIERIEIDGFGRFHDAAWPLDDGLTVLHGENEAGKTTLLNAVRALLFGFESTRDGRTWYPALAGGRRGGRLVLRTRGGERWTVERHGERGGSGALAVRAPNGNQGGQETLDRLLHGADRDLFNNIFAFGLGELQTFASLSADGVRGRIYGAGAGLGGTSAIDLERGLRRLMDDVFLPRGRERPLNQLLARIEELRGEIADLSHQPQEHAEAHREREELRAHAAALRDAVRDERERASRVARLLEARAPAAALATAAEELGSGDPALDELPPDAIAVLERHEAALDTARVAVAAIERELGEARAERDGIRPDEAVLAAADRIIAVRDEAVARGAIAGRRDELEAARTRHAHAVEEQVTRAGGLDEARLVRLDDSIASVEGTRELERGVVEARGVAAEADRRERTAAEEAAARERDAHLPDATDEEVADRLAATEALDALRIRWALAEARSAPAIHPRVAVVVAVIAGVVAIIAGFVLLQPLIGLAVGLVAAALAFFAARGGVADELSALADERRLHLDRAGLPPDADDAAIRALAAELTAQRVRAGLADDERAVVAARRADLERRVAEATAAREALAAAEGAWRTWLRDAGLPDAVSPEAARHLLGAAGIARRAASERDHQAALLATHDRDAAAHAGRVDELASALGVAPPPDAARRDAFIIGVVERLEVAREADRRSRDLDAAIGRLVARRDAAATSAEEREAALGSFLTALGCPDAGTLRARAHAAGERRALSARVKELRAGLRVMAGGADGVDLLVTEALSADPAGLEASLADAREQLERREEEERGALNRIGALDARIRQLEAAQELGTRRQELAGLEGRAAALATEWAARALTLRMLEETRSRYERERQPDVVRAATAHFERITGGKYARIVAPPGDTGVRVETEGGEGRATEELSRGTAEQLYLALRFGLIEEFARNAEPLPVVMDDILVNFDPGRAERAAATIRDLASRHQVLYFTCHRSTVALLDPDGTRTLALG